MTTETETPAWVVPGTPVLVIAGRDGMHLTVTSIAKVHKRYFTVDHYIYTDKRFSLDRQEARAGDIWTTNPVVVPVGSPRGREVLAEKRRRVLVRHAETACTKWQRDPTRDNRLAAIAALQAVEDESCCDCST